MLNFNFFRNFISKYFFSIFFLLIFLIFVFILLNFLFLKEKNNPLTSFFSKNEDLTNREVNFFGAKKEKTKSDNKYDYNIENKSLFSEKEILKNEKNKSLIIINKSISLGKKEVVPGTNNKTIYPSAIICEKDKCENQPGDKQLTIPFLWVLLNFYKLNKNPKILSVVKDNINYISDQNLQPFFWNCKFIKDILAFGEIKDYDDKIKNLCKSSAWLYFSEIENYSRSVNPNFFSYESIKNNIENEGSKDTDSRLLLPSDYYEFLAFSSYVADLISKYQLFQSYSDVLLARAYFDSALRYYINNKNDESLTGLPILVIGSFYLYDATKNKNYADLGFYLSDKALKLNRRSVQNILYISFLNEEMFKRTRNKAYVDDIVNIMKYIEKNFYNQKMGLIYTTKSFDHVYYDFLDNVFYSYFYYKYIK